MRNIIYLMHVSLDGFVAGPNGEMEWIRYDEELEKYSHDMTKTADATIYGRVTYKMMEWYWPTVSGNPNSAKSEVEYANWLNRATKIVCSKTLDKVEWENSLLIGDNIVEEITRIKQEPGQNILMFGSSTLAQTLMQHNLIDEYRINVNPVVLGEGKPLFASQELKLNLLEARPFKVGVVSLRYEPQRQQ